MKSVINRITSFMGKNKKRDAEVDCPICLEPLEGEPTIETLCKHNFHRKCLRTWCNTKIDSLCPVCRKTITATCTTLNPEPQIQAPQIQAAPIQANWRDNLDYDTIDWGASYDENMRRNNEWEPVFYARWLTRGKPITNHVKILDLGEAVYKNIKRAPDKEAVVKVIWFHSEDSVYKEVPIDWKGETLSAKLLNQVAEFEPRNKKILEVVEEYSKDPNRFILILSDRISQLEWFDKELKCIHGYYIGGMKQAKLDENAEKCQILLATYQMASEAFSVKKLNTVVLATPRKKVEQSTGRIFRQRMDERKVAPHIIDIIDSHECHKRRWYIRQKFYKECEYTFQYIDKPKKNKIDANVSLFKF